MLHSFSAKSNVFQSLLSPSVSFSFVYECNNFIVKVFDQKLVSIISSMVLNSIT